MFGSVEEANANLAVFSDSARETNEGPCLIVVDDFYKHPRAVRELALQMRLEIWPGTNRFSFLCGHMWGLASCFLG